MTNTVRGVGRARHEANRRHQQRTPLPPKPPIKDRPELNGVERPGALSDKAAKFRADIGMAGWKVSTTIKGSTELITATRGEETIDIGWKAGKHQYDLTWYSAPGGKRRHLRNGSEALKVAGAKPSESPRKAPTPPDTRRTAPEPRAVASTTGNLQPARSNGVARRSGVWKPSFDGSGAARLPFGFDGSAANGNGAVPVRKATRRIPFDSDAPAPEILQKVSGQKLTWVNSLSHLHESAIVLPNAKSIELYDCADGRRCLTFPAYKGSIRTVDLSRLVSVR